MLLVAEQVIAPYVMPTHAHIMDNSLRPRIDRLVHLLLGVIARILHKTGQVFEDERVLEDASGVLGPAIYVLFLLIDGLGLQVLHLRLIVHILRNISQLTAILRRAAASNNLL